MRHAESIPLAKTAFAQLHIPFTPKTPDVAAQELKCEDDIAICNRECERVFGSMPEQMEEPCKLAVASHFTGGAACFPATAAVHERQRGKVRIVDVRVGDELVALPGDEFSRVVALLHDSPGCAELYLRVRHSGGELALSPQHLLRARRRPRPPSLRDGAAVQQRTASTSGQWAWLPAQDLRPGDELLDAHGSAVSIVDICRACLQGAHAPLTSTGTLVVDGVLCSCYAPPAAWAVPHEACHAAMMPLRLLDSLRTAAERWSQRAAGGKEPLLTVEALWLLPPGDDETLHPYASGLLRTANLAIATAAHFRTLLQAQGAKVSAPGAAATVEEDEGEAAKLLVRGASSPRAAAVQ